MRHVVNYSGGEASWYAAELVAEEHGTCDLTLLFADVFVEAPDLYRFLIESAASVFRLPRPDSLLARARALPPLREIEARKAALKELARDAMRHVPGLVWVAEGRTPWEVFRDVKFIGNSRVDPCSRILKRDFLGRWVAANCDPAETVLYFGLDANEAHRLEAVRERHNPHWTLLRLLSYLMFAQGGLYFVPTLRTVWRCESPLLNRDIFKEYLRNTAEQMGLRRSESYDLNVGHDNCSNACVKAGQGAWLVTLKKRPEVYAYAESEEAETRAHIGRDDVAVLRDRAGGETAPLSLTAFRERVEAGAQVDMFDLGGCGCGV